MTGARKRILYLVLGAALAGGTYLRFVDIGRFAFWTDEYMHVFSAQSYLENGKLEVPYVGPYPRAYPITYMTVASFKLFGESEAAARIPFAAANVLFLMVAFFVVRRLFSETTAAAFLVIMAFTPLAILLSRECRMYTVHQFLFFLMSLAALSGAEDIFGLGGKGRSFISTFEKKYDVHISSIVVAALLCKMCVTVHELTYGFAITVISYAVTMTVVTGVRQGWVAALRSKYMICLGALFLIFVGAVIRNEEFVRRMDRRAFHLHDWQVYKDYDHRFYRWWFMDHYPVLAALYPVGAYVLIRKYGKTGLFFVLSFVPLILAHSYIFERKSDRYIFYIFPYFVLAAAAAVDVGVSAFGRFWSEHSAPRVRWQRAPAVLALVVALGFVAHPWAMEAVDAATSPRYPDWKSIPESVKKTVNAGTVVTMNPREFIYYFGRKPDYYWLVEVKKYRTYDPVLMRSFIEFKEGLEKPNATFVCAQWNFFNKAFVNEKMHEYVDQNMVLVPHGGDPRILIFRKTS